MIFTSAFIILLTLTSKILLYKAEKITQESLIVGSEGKSLDLSCSHPSISTSERIFWYQQFLNQGPRVIVSAYSKEAKSEILKTVTLIVSEDRKSSILSFSRVSLEDSAVYYCALDDLGGGTNKVTFGKGTKLTIILNLEDSPPSIYELRPDASAGGEKKDKAACLITDYFPNPLKVKSKEGEKEVEVNGSVVVVKEEDAEKGTGSYGIVLWGDKDDNFHCAASDKNGQKFESNTADDPGTCLAESGDNGAFETDERLNLLSLTVLGLRVVFLKSVAFNLLLTFRLWSRGG